MRSIIPAIMVIGAGGSLAVQQVLNARLRDQLGSPWWAGVASYGVGLLAMSVAAAALQSPIPTVSAIVRGPPILWAGGIFGAIFVGTGIVMVPRLGVAGVLALVVVGQMLGSLMLDHLGAFGLPHHPMTAARAAGAAFLAIGVVLVRS